MTEDEEVFWAKLTGDWNSAGYRVSLAQQGKCIGTLLSDENATVRVTAINYLVNHLDDAKMQDKLFEDDDDKN